MSDTQGEPLTVLARRAEQFALGYTNLGEGFHREQCIDFFVRGVLWMRHEYDRMKGGGESNADL
jgi:hypothetical protein